MVSLALATGLRFRAVGVHNQPKPMMAAQIFDYSLRLRYYTFVLSRRDIVEGSLEVPLGCLE